MRFYKLLLPLLFTSSLFAARPAGLPPQGGNIRVNNTILAKVNGTTISVLDVMKKLDVFLSHAAPELTASPAARFQFYNANWQHVLNEMINTELITADAKVKELKLSDGEIREEMEQRFGPGIIMTLEKLHLTYEEAWQMVKRDLIVGRMTWYYVNSKALQAVSPQTLKENYRQFCKEHPSVEQWKYHIVSIRENEGSNGQRAAEKIYNLLVNSSLENLKEQIDALLEEFKGCAISISDLYEVSSKDLSMENKTILSALAVDSFSHPAKQTSKFSNKAVYRIFNLKDYQKIETPSFESVSTNLRERLLQKTAQKLLAEYQDKLKKFYGNGDKSFKEPLPSDFHPFVLE